MYILPLTNKNVPKVEKIKLKKFIDNICLKLKTYPTVFFIN